MRKDWIREGAFRVVCLLAGALLAVSACARETSPGIETPPGSAVTADGSAAEWLAKAVAKAEEMDRYAFVLQMDQKLSATNDNEHSDVRIDMQGRVEREPFKLDQTIDSAIDEEKSTVRAILTHEAYYMYLPEFEEWSKLSREVAEENLATLSDLQANPERAIGRIAELGAGLRAEREGSAVVVRYEGAGEQAKPFVADLLRSTLGIPEGESDIANSLEVDSLSVYFKMDAERDWPLAYRLESDLVIELEPGLKTNIRQTVSGTYAKPNETEPIVVPEEALNAPDPAEIGDILNPGGE
ncbi:DUF6612 family protein [Paenibacillaceae bacterium WGS1546]|uniref:DUF6612 family protein n=1 Tax=Cohnella sp. WGS1546 TaxID=3366810 RepID=UPI00372D5932